MEINTDDQLAGSGEGSIAVPVVREELRLEKRVVETGRGVRIHKTVSERTEQVDQPLFHDAVEVRRVAVDRIVPLSERPAARQEGDTTILPIVEEVLVVEKRLRIKEEIHIVRSRSAQRHVESVVLRSEDVAVERYDEGQVPSSSPTPSSPSRR